LFIQTLKQAEDALKAADVTLALKRKQLADVESQVASLKANLKRVEDEMADLQGQVLLTENRLIRAGKLTAALGDEAVNYKLFPCVACLVFFTLRSPKWRPPPLCVWYH